MSTQKRLQVKKADHSLLIQLYAHVKTHQTPHFTEDTLQTLGVSVSRAGHSSDGIDPNFNPIFFEPAMRQKLKASLAKAPQGTKFPTFAREDAFSDVLTTTHGLDLYFTSRLQQPTDEREYVRLQRTSCWALKQPADSPYRPLNNFNGIQNWRVTQLFDSETPAKPHMMVTMMNEIDARDDCLLQGELMTIIRVMHGRIPLRLFQEQLVFPILIISYTGVQHARLVQGHIQNGKLHIQYTKLYDLRTEQMDIINLFLRYFLSVPVGDTKLAHIKG